MTRAPWPVPLRPGDRVALVAPSGVVEPEHVDAGAAVLRDWGQEPVEMPHVRARHGHMAGNDDQRRADLQAALDDPGIRAIWSVRGGYGATRLVGRVDWSSMVADPRWFVGLSDVTALHHDLWRATGVVSCHGTNAGRLAHLDAHPVTAAHLRALLAGEWTTGPLPQPAGAPPPRPVAGGTAVGPLLGGNLALLCAGIGTPNQLDTRGAVLLLEDVHEAPYRVDRMLTQLRSAGLLADVAGIALGGFLGGDPPAHVPSHTIAEVVEERLGNLGVPVLADLPVGHHDRDVAVPHGATVELDVDSAVLGVLPG